jgi:hypothetical protein
MLLSRVPAEKVQRLCHPATESVGRNMEIDNSLPVLKISLIENVSDDEQKAVVI